MTSSNDSLFREADYEEPLRLTRSEEDELVAAEPDPVPVNFSAQDFDVEGLVRRINKREILVPTYGHADEQIITAGFQRNFVWNRPQMDRFVESILLGYPVPGVFFVRQTDKRYLVLDGQQRLRTLQYFYAGTYNNRTFSLSNVGRRLQNLTYELLDEEQQRTMDNAFIQATIVDTDGSPQSLEAIYQIFERLNSGGTQLTPHEIRVALYAGPFVDYLDTLNRIGQWRSLYGKVSPRLRDQELVLRIVAAFTDSENYERPLKTYLNTFLAQNRNISEFSQLRVARFFEDAAELLLGVEGKAALRPRGGQVNAAFTEAIFVGLMRKLEFNSGYNDYRAVSRVVRSLATDEDMDAATSSSTAEPDVFQSRIEIATSAFAEG